MLGQRNIKCATKDCLLFESGFASNISYEAVMDVGSEIVGIFKTNTKVLCKDTINNLARDCT